MGKDDQNWIWTSCWGGPEFSRNLWEYKVENPKFRVTSNGYYCWVSPEMDRAWGSPPVKYVDYTLVSIALCTQKICPQLNGLTYTGPCPHATEFIWNVASNYPCHGNVVKMVNDKGDYCGVTSPAQYACLNNPAMITTKFNVLPLNAKPLGDCKC